ncbi:MAG: cell division protein SepF [Clostridia bacterium]
MDDRRRDYNENEQNYFGRRYVPTGRADDDNRRTPQDAPQRQDRRNSPFAYGDDSNGVGFGGQNANSRNASGQIGNPNGNQNGNQGVIPNMSGQGFGNNSFGQAPNNDYARQNSFGSQYGNAPQQPMNGQPMSGQPMSGQPMSGQPMQNGQPANGYQRAPQQPYGAMPQQYIPPQNKPYEDNFDYDYNAQYASQQNMVDDQSRKKKGLFSSFRNKKEDDGRDIQNVIITYPKTFTDVQVIIDSLRNRQAIIVDLTKIIDKNSQRILDYLSGAIYALGGSQQRIGDSMFLFTPDGVSIQGPADLKKKYD